LLALAFIVVSSPYAQSNRAEAGHVIDWWLTDNAAVVSESVGDNGSVCSLFLYNKDNAMVVSWGRDASISLRFNSTSWHLQPAEQVPVKVAIGNAYLGRAESNQPSLTATTDQGWLLVPLQRSIDDLLAQATKITLEAPNHDLSFDISKPKMSKLLLAAKRCRAVETSH